MAIRVLALFAGLLMSAVPAQLLANDDQFEIGPGDVIAISVYNEPDLAVKAKISKSGVVRIPLVGDVPVIGKTANQLGQELEAAYLDGYLVSPSVSVVIESFRPFYIRGAVKSSGAYEFEFDLTVEQAVAVAGGLQARASKKDWYIIRGRDKQRLKADKDTLVKPGDIIEIEESLF